jgi:hypothetical protein
MRFVKERRRVEGEVTETRIFAPGTTINTNSTSGSPVFKSHVSERKSGHDVLLCFQLGFFPLSPLTSSQPCLILASAEISTARFLRSTYQDGISIHALFAEFEIRW